MVRAHLKAFAVPATIFGFAVLVLPAIAQNELPAGPGMEETMRACGGCHGIGQLLAEKRSTQEWANTVTAMITLGAPVSNDDFDKVVTYLATYFGPTPPPAAPPQ